MVSSSRSIEKNLWLKCCTTSRVVLQFAASARLVRLIFAGFLSIGFTFSRAFLQPR